MGAGQSHAWVTSQITRKALQAVALTKETPGLAAGSHSHYGTSCSRPAVTVVTGGAAIRF